MLSAFISLLVANECRALCPYRCNNYRVSHATCIAPRSMGWKFLYRHWRWMWERHHRRRFVAARTRKKAAKFGWNSIIIHTFLHDVSVFNQFVFFCCRNTLCDATCPWMDAPNTILRRILLCLAEMYKHRARTDSRYHTVVEGMYVQPNRCHCTSQLIETLPPYHEGALHAAIVAPLWESVVHTAHGKEVVMF